PRSPEARAKRNSLFQVRIAVGSDPEAPGPENLDAVVQQVASEAHVQLSALRPEERAYLKDHALKKPLRVLDIWALGVGVVITGAYFGWNLGLKGNGPVAMLIASLIVCLLYLTWVLALAELSVAMPFAGGPLAYGRRAFGPPLGFLMGWSMFLECQFATIATALATGGYVAFVLNPDNPSPEVKVWAALATVVIFFLLLGWAQLTLIGLVLLTWLFACGALDSQELAVNVARDARGTIQLDEQGEVSGEWVDYPLAKVMDRVLSGRWPLVLYGFGAIALFGMIASYHGMVYGTRRQAFSLGRAGYLSPSLGGVH